LCSYEVGFFAATGWFCGGGCGAAWGWPLKSLWPRVHILQQRSLWPTVTPPTWRRPCWLLVYTAVQALHHRTSRCRRSKVGYKTKAFVLPSTTTATSKTKVCSTASLNWCCRYCRTDIMDDLFLFENPNIIYHLWNDKKKNKENKIIYNLMCTDPILKKTRFKKVCDPELPIKMPIDSWTKVPLINHGTIKQ
jgi:hypothetical protein